MNKLLIATAVIALSATSVFAQETKPAANPDGDTPAVATPSEQNSTAPVEGANSFTEEQAKERIAEAGYADVTDLKLDDKGVWQGKATKDGKPLMVSMDYQGNIVAK
ncbi:PepSY domain-containing protein [Pararhizobium sp. DWP3-4]|uniref:PepSY domain-containing protein n=1 Tax=unclassified Pararhizobium TaxID=2643050 RepID=UPI003CF19D76